MEEYGGLAMACVDVKELSTAVDELLAEDPEAAGHWRLCLFKMFDDEGRTFDGISTVDFVRIDDRFGGSSTMRLASNGEVRAQVDIDVEGEIHAGTAILDLHILDEGLRAVVFECRGSTTGSEVRYDGSWFAACPDPVKCGCSGLSGRFELLRMDP